MKELALLIDFGSTFTKLVVVDLRQEEVVGTSQAPTTAEKGLLVGLQEALGRWEKATGLAPAFRYKLACSSAAGGLRMVAVGLVKELTAEAARRAALGAGARVTRIFTHELTEAELEAIAQMEPDIILLAGGTDGGNREVLLHNSRMLARLEAKVPVVVAGNKVVAGQAAACLRRHRREVVVTENVMPELNQLHIEPARSAIREVFLRRIVEAKGLPTATQWVDQVVMPTPAAVLKAIELLSCGWGREPGWGELVAVDVGGATTDVYSMTWGEPTRPGVQLKGLPEPYAKRTVEGDLGMRYSALSTLEGAGEAAFGRHGPLPQGFPLRDYLAALEKEPGHLPENEAEAQVERALARTAVELALARHGARLEVYYTPMGAAYVQIGKDLTGVKTLIGTGGVLRHAPSPREVLEAGTYRAEDPYSLKPEAPAFFLDSQYVLSAMGLLAEVAPETALRIMTRSLQSL